MSTSTVTLQAIQTRLASERVRVARALRRFLPVFTVLLWITLAIPSDGYLGTARTDLIVQEAVGSHGFKLAAWERQALLDKAHEVLTQPGANLSPQAQHDLVISYFDTFQRITNLANQIQRIYADPKQSDSHAAAAPLQAQLDALRRDQAQRRAAVEHTLESQVSTVLAAEGLTTAGIVWPPVSFQFAESPNYLVISPRDRIYVEKGVYVDPALAVSQMEQMEQQVETDLDVSALVEGTGGFSSYPTMIIEIPDMEWVLSTIAHEWTHTYLAFKPLGWSYFDSGNMRTINETVATIVGDEVGQRVLEQYYPEKVPPPSWPEPHSMQPQETPKQEFDFGAFMRQTRLTVDKMLAAGQITQAESYMDAQREVLAKHGYLIRKLNQAYFAFHGSYAVGPSATDPIGGKLRLLRTQSGSLAEFIHVVSGFRTVADLDAALH